MRYGSPYKIIEFDARALRKINRAINNNPMEWEKGVVPEAKGRVLRKSEVTWINDESVDNILLEACDYCNNGNWGLDIQGVEPVQFGIYPEGGFYDWHVDQHNARLNQVRKISMSLFLNEDYEGCEFTVGTKRMKPMARSSVVFPSNFLYPHQADVVTKGTRWSIVSWLM